MRELLVAAGNGSYTDAERANLGARIRGLREQLFSIANRGDTGLVIAATIIPLASIPTP